MPDFHERVLCIAAHPDDDAIGCGGTLATLARAGARTDVVYVSDGSRSHPGSRRFPPDRVAAIRALEARASLRALGIATDPQFLAFPDGGLHALDAADAARAVAAIGAAVERSDPGVVFAPWIRDPHPDHVAAAAFARRALALERPRMDLHGYEVWLPVRGDGVDMPRAGEARTIERALDDDAVAAKRRAILAHVSQTTDLIDDDPGGFRIDETLLDGWLRPFERFHVLSPDRSIRVWERE